VPASHGAEDGAGVSLGEPGEFVDDPVGQLDRGSALAEALDETIVAFELPDSTGLPPIVPLPMSVRNYDFSQFHPPLLYARRMRAAMKSPARL
jgi:hypothetical protein